MEDSAFYVQSNAPWARRHVLGGMAAFGLAIPGMASCRYPDAPGDAARIPDYRRPGDPDDTAAAERAMSAASTIYFPARQGSGPNGDYLLNALRLRTGVTLYGDGEASVLRASASEAPSILTAMSGVDRPLRNIAMRDMRLEGHVAQTGFREHQHLVAISGVSGLRIERIQFVGFAGDGLYLGAERAWPTREPRVIRDVIVSECLFDGVNNDNRNGISVTGGSDIVIERCRFRRCTRPNMPGPIDFEPDAFPFYRLERLRVIDCHFEDCGGNLGQIGIMVPKVVPTPRHVLIAGNSFRGYVGTGADVALSINRQPDASMPGMDCVIERNVGVGGRGGVGIFSGKGIIVRGNRWTGYSGQGFLGFAEPTAGVMEVSISDRFDGCGWRDGVAFAVHKGDGVRLESNLFAGTGNGGPGSAPLYLGTGRIRRLSLLRNDLRNNPAARGLMIVERGADVLSSTTEMAGNLVPAGRSLPDL